MLTYSNLSSPPPGRLHHASSLGLLSLRLFVPRPTVELAAPAVRCRTAPLLEEERHTPGGPPLSPPAITQSSVTSLGQRCDSCSGMNIVKSTGPSSGSQLTKRTAVGVSSSSGMRSSAQCWFSTDTPSQTLRSGQPG